MARYMPQDVFDSCVVGAVKLHMMERGPLDQVCAEICGHYKRSYRDDVRFEIEIKEASQQILEWCRSLCPEEEIAPTMTQFQHCLTYYELDGQKKQRRLFSGTLLNKAKFHNPNRVKDCIRNISIYYIGSIGSKFPIAPDGWSLASR